MPDSCAKAFAPTIALFGCTIIPAKSTRVSISQRKVNVSSALFGCTIIPLTHTQTQTHRHTDRDTDTDTDTDTNSTERAQGRCVVD
eukprot:3933071-Rhodomonas_salina.1